MKAVILAAGEGRRLRPLTTHRPKVMLPVGGRPILEHVVHALSESGVTDLTFVVGYERAKIQTHFQDGRDHGADIHYVTQDQQLGTGHALGVALAKMLPDEPFLVFPGDNWIAPSLVKALIKAKGDAALITTQSADPGHYGVVSLDGEKVRRIEEKPPTPTTRIISTGIYRLPPSIGAHLDRHPDDLALPDVLNHAIQEGLDMAAVATEDAWLDVAYPWDVLRANHRVLQDLKKGASGGKNDPGVTLAGAVDIGNGTRIRAGSYIVGPVRIGEHCDIGPNAVIRGPATIGSHVRIGPFTDLENVAILDGAEVDTGAILRHTVVDEGARIGPRVSADRGPSVWDMEDTFHRVTELGAVIGQDAFLGANVVLEPGAVIGNRAAVAANRTVHRVPDDAMVA